MTALRRDGDEPAWKAWIRNEPQLDSVRHCLSITDSDIWVHRFSNRKERRPNTPMLEHLMIVEVKEFGASIPFAQNDTLKVIDAILRKATNRGGRRCYIKIPDDRFVGRRCFRHVRWTGTHLLQLSADSPANSDRILWDGRLITIQTLIGLLRFDLDPDHPTRRLDTRRHHLVLLVPHSPSLFESGAA